jgi:hypothetical protein
LNTMARRRGAVGNTNFVLGKWSRKDFKGSVAKFVDDKNDVEACDTACWSNGSANFWAVDPLPCRINRVVLCSCNGGTMSGGKWAGDFDLAEDMVERIVDRS